MKWYKKSPPIWFLLISLAGAILIATLYSVYCGSISYGTITSVDSDVPIPKELGSYKLVEVKLGKEAIDSISKIHPFISKDPKLEDAMVVIYTSQDEVIHIYATTFDSKEYASELVSKMYNSMSLGFSPYTVPHLMNIYNVTVYMGEGMGMKYIYFVKDDTVVWISYTSGVTLDNEVLRDILEFI